MNPVKVKKELIKFARREWKEKRPIKVSLFKVKDYTILKRGLLPSTLIKQRPNPYYLVIVEYTNSLRIYFFTIEGILLEGKNVENNSQMHKDLQKSCSLIFKFPKDGL